MSFSNTAETAINNYIFKGTPVSWEANTDLWLALFKSDPGEAGSAVTNEADYTNYARVAIDRATEIDVSGATATVNVLAQFPICGVTSNTVTHIGFVTSNSGAGTLIASGALDASQTIQLGNQPQFNANTLIFTLD